MAHVGLARCCSRPAEWRVLKESTRSRSFYIYCKAPQPGQAEHWTAEHNGSRHTWDNGDWWSHIILLCFWLENVAQQSQTREDSLILGLPHASVACIIIPERKKKLFILCCLLIYAFTTLDGQVNSLPTSLLKCVCTVLALCFPSCSNFP